MNNNKELGMKKIKPSQLIEIMQNLNTLSTSELMGLYNKILRLKTPEFGSWTRSRQTLSVISVLTIRSQESLDRANDLYKDHNKAA